MVGGRIGNGSICIWVPWLIREGSACVPWAGGCVLLLKNREQSTPEMSDKVPFFSERLKAHRARIGNVCHFKYC